MEIGLYTNLVFTIFRKYFDPYCGTERSRLSSEVTNTHITLKKSNRNDEDRAEKKKKNKTKLNLQTEVN